MFNQLRVEDSLFNISQNEVEKFKSLASQTNMLVSLKITSSVTEKDGWGTIFNTWLLFLEKGQSIGMDYSKYFVYSCNFYSAQILRETTEIKLFFQLYKKTDYTAYLLSYYVGRELLIWTYNLLSSSPEGCALMKKNYNRDYFYLMKDEELVSDYSHEHYMDQKLMTSLMGQSYSKTDEYTNHIKNALQYTKQHLTSQKM